MITDKQLLKNQDLVLKVSPDVDPSKFKVTHSWQSRQKATKLLEEAKRKVEDMIEGAPSS